MEQADGVGAAADAGDGVVRQAAFALQHLGPGFAADDGLEVAHHGREGVRAHDAADEVVGGRDVGDPVAHGLVDRVLEGAGAGGDAAHLGAEQAHAEDVGRLPRHVDLAHVDDALEAEVGADRGGGDAVLAGAGLGDDARLAEALREQALADGVVDLVGAGVGEVLSLEVDLGAAELLREVGGEVERRRPAGEVAQHVRHLFGEGRVGLGGLVGGVELLDGGHEGLGDVDAAEIAETPVFVRQVVHCCSPFRPA